MPRGSGNDMKAILAIVLFATLGSVAAQGKMSTKTGKITFEASVPSFEEIKARNDAATCVLNTATGEIASLAMIRGFRFKIALMEEHFNENYLESDKYPKATFRGKIENFKLSDVTDDPKNYNLRGKLELHGNTREINAPAKIRRTAGGIEIITDFVVNTNDYEIGIPAVVRNKISKNVTIHGEFLVK